MQHISLIRITDTAPIAPLISLSLKTVYCLVSYVWLRVRASTARFPPPRALFVTFPNEDTLGQLKRVVFLLYQITYKISSKKALLDYYCSLFLTYMKDERIRQRPAPSLIIGPRNPAKMYKYMLCILIEARTTHTYNVGAPLQPTSSLTSKVCPSVPSHLRHRPDF